MSVALRSGQGILDVRHSSSIFVASRALRPGSIVKAVAMSAARSAKGNVWSCRRVRSGKSTIGRCILRLIEPTRRRLFRGKHVLQFSRQRMRLARRDMQIVFQESVLVTQPANAGGRHRGKPLVIHRPAPGGRRARVPSFLACRARGVVRESLSP